jgi:hypothetical protein
VKIATLLPAAVAFVMLGTAYAQLPKQDTVRVTLPYPVIVEGKTLAPGDYTIEQMPDGGNSSPVLLIYNTSVRVQTVAMTTRDTTRDVDTRTPTQSTVLIHRLGNKYYLDQVWVEGDPYGYVIVLPASVRSHEREMESITLPAHTGH